MYHDLGFNWLYSTYTHMHGENVYTVLSIARYQLP